jgi:hypothetical protein
MATEIPKAEILRCLRRRGRALTDREITRVVLGRKGDSDALKPAINELIAAGTIRTVALARDQATGDLVRKVWFAP